ncbi:MAG: Chaperone protein DnaK [Deltaproteobacteria bacterium]|nr:Chaperone protein DnaK [Deltaproteobacteria bacterium]
MARVGVDFGTTNTVVVCSDRGRYPVIPHGVDTAIGRVVRDVFPSLLAYEHASGRFLFGPDAERCLARPGAERRYGVIRSIKRDLRKYVGGGRIGHAVQPGGFDTAAVLTGFATALRDSVRHSGLLDGAEPLQAVITWPANANGAQRYITRQCFKEAGFEVIGTVNEPTAAAIEFADRLVRGNRSAARKLSATVVVFDFGGGTFDCSLVRISGGAFTVIDTAGVEELGGDDLDRVLAQMFAQQLRLDLSALSHLQSEQLLRHACQQKESIATGTVRSLVLVPSDIGLRGGTGTVPVPAYFDQLRPLIAPAVETLEHLVCSDAARAAGVAPDRLDAIYLVGGSSKLPLVAEMIAARFPTARLVMSDKPFTATAMGAAIHSAETVTLHDILSRHFGVLRLADHGEREFFAPIFAAGTRLPPPGGPPLVRTVAYSPRHNIGHLRYFECAGVDAQGQPGAGARQWSDVLFPYDPAIPIDGALHPGAITSRADLAGERICETYACDSDGVITVRVRRERDGQSRCYEIFRN